MNECCWNALFTEQGVRKKKAVGRDFQGLALLVSILETSWAYSSLLNNGVHLK